MKHSKIKKLIFDILKYVKTYKRLTKNYDFIEAEIDKFHWLAVGVFNCKYSSDILTHINN